MDMTSYLLGKQAGGGTIVETDPIYSSSPASEITAEDITNWNNKSDFSGNYNDLTNKPTIPEAVQYSTIPTASADNLGKIVQFTGTTDSTYTNGYFYKCVSDGQDPATYSWENIDVMNAGGGSTYTAGTNINIDSNNAINCTIPITYKADDDACFIIGKKPTLTAYGLGYGTNCKIQGGGVAIGNNTELLANYTVAVGPAAKAKQQYSNAFGRFAEADHAYSMAFGGNAVTTKNNQVVFGSTIANINEVVIYSNSGLKNLATEEFVINYLTTLSTYDATKTQVLKNVSGTLTWVTEE